jgi:hypothetical protein
MQAKDSLYVSAQNIKKAARFALPLSTVLLALLLVALDQLYLSKFSASRPVQRPTLFPAPISEFFDGYRTLRLKVTGVVEQRNHVQCSAVVVVGFINMVMAKSRNILSIFLDFAEFH